MAIDMEEPAELVTISQSFTTCLSQLPLKVE
jgi:hypothetical protein